MSTSEEECTITEQEITKAIHALAGSSEATVVRYEIKPASETPLGFLGEHVRVNATAILNGVQQGVKFFGKKVPTKIASHREYAEKTKAFYKEIELYKTLFDDISKALSPVGRQRQWRPSCYFTRDWDLLLLEDLSTQNYYMLPERTLMELDYVRVAIKTMAHMHAGSIIFEAKINAGEAETHSVRNVGGVKIAIADLYPNLIFESECTDEPGHPGYTFWEVGIRSQLGIIELLQNYTDKEKELIREKFSNTIRKTYAMVKPSEKYRNVIIHGDLWGNNILFKNGDNGHVEKAIIVDFQMARYAPPAHDLLMFLHIVQDNAFRDEHDKSLLDMYYDSLTKELAAEGLNIETHLPLKEFQESCDYFRKYAILNQIIYTQLNITPAEVCAKFLSTPEMYNKVIYEDRTEMLVESFKTDEFCRRRTTEAMNNVIEMFELNKV